MNRLRVASAIDARAAIANALLARSQRASSVGEIQLKPHQIEAVETLRSAIKEFGGALLADPVGTGKTFVALALIDADSDTTVVAPAVLRDMWIHAASIASRRLQFVSFESLSRRHVDSTGGNMVIVDEAHHARNPSAKRFANLSRLVSGKNVLLLSATPIHNRREDLVSLLRLFMGSRAESLNDAELARIVIRRAKLRESTPGFPVTGDLDWCELTEDDRIPLMLLGLPPPLAPADGGDGGALVAHSLIRQWMSSDAALIGGLKRRLVRAEGLIAALEDGTWPSRAELASWISGEDTVQLAFAGLLAAPTPESR
ncbi:MAG TPA: SNF2-related protein, partial [Gemmatimonadaceae bacterium]